MDNWIQRVLSGGRQAVKSKGRGKKSATARHMIEQSSKFGCSGGMGMAWGQMGPAYVACEWPSRCRASSTM